MRVIIYSSQRAIAGKNSVSRNSSRTAKDASSTKPTSKALHESKARIKSPTRSNLTKHSSRTRRSSKTTMLCTCRRLTCRAPRPPTGSASTSGAVKQSTEIVNKLICVSHSARSHESTKQPRTPSIFSWTNPLAWTPRSLETSSHTYPTMSMRVPSCRSSKTQKALLKTFTREVSACAPTTASSPF